MELPISKLTEIIEYCLLPKLTSNFDERDYHPEYDIRKSRLHQYFPILLQLLEENLIKISKTTKPLPLLLIFSYELQTSGPWNTGDCEEYSIKLNHLQLKGILQKNENNAQEIFDECLEKLHQKLTSNDFKKYPSLIEVYCALIQEIQLYNLTLNPVTTLPTSLLLIDDYMRVNKIKGLKCCISILQFTSPNHFANGNYYEVIYGYLKKNVFEKDLELTILVHKCFLELLRILPSNVKVNKTDDLYSNVLDQLHTDANLYRKAELFSFTKNLIHIHQVNCINKKSFKTIVCDALDVCCNEAVGEILLSHVLECLEEWIKHSWCIWQLSTDQKLLSVLFKCLFVCKNENCAESMVNLILTLISLSTDDEQMQIVNSLEKSTQVISKQFQQRIDLIKKNISVK